MSAAPWIIIGIIGALLLGVVVSLRSKKKKHVTDYRAIFYLGLVWFALGISGDMNVFFILGLAYMAIGLSNKNKWRKQRKLTKREKRIMYGAIAVLFVFFIIGVLIFLDLGGMRTQLFGCRLINDFESCAAAGNAVMESYPRQCRACDRTFTEEI